MSGPDHIHCGLCDNTWLDGEQPTCTCELTQAFTDASLAADLEEAAAVADRAESMWSQRMEGFMDQTESDFLELERFKRVAAACRAHAKRIGGGK
jgi:hypothetical protein